MNRIVGIHAVEQALRAGSGKRLLLKQGELNARQTALQELAVKMNCPVERAELNDTVQGAALEVIGEKVRPEADLDDLLPRGSLFLALDSVTDPRNLGACLRSAAGFGVDGLIVPKDKSATLNEAAIKTASGAASIVPTFQVTNLSRTLGRLQKAGFWVVGTVLDDSVPLADVDLTGPTVLVMGSEDRGIRRNTRERCDFLARIPMPLQDLSLNVAVATGVALYEIQRQRAR